jgi:hypothetical protein
MADSSSKRTNSRESSPNKNRRQQTTEPQQQFKLGGAHQTPAKASTFGFAKPESTTGGVFQPPSNATIVPQPVDIGIKDLVDITASKSYLYRALASTGK